jgi:hypothetical protein
VKTTIHTPAGRIVLEQSATRASVQVAFFPADAAPFGFLVPNASAGVFAQGIEAIATINEESNPVELPGDAFREPYHLQSDTLHAGALAAARAFASGLSEVAE